MAVGGDGMIMVDGQFAPVDDRIKAAAAALQTKTYEKAVVRKVKDRRAELRHFPHAHTDGDTYVYFADANVLAIGDIISVGNRYPNIDVANGGSIKGMIAAVDVYLKLANDRTKIVPGHGPLLNRAQVADYRKMRATARDQASKLVAAKPLASLEKITGANEVASANFVRLIYRSLKA